jgi:hypothetical protein
LGGRRDSPVCGGDDLVGEVDQSASGRLWQRDQSIGSDLAARGPGDAFVARLTLLDRDLGSPWDLMPMMRAGAVRPGWSAAVSRTT